MGLYYVDFGPFEPPASISVAIDLMKSSFMSHAVRTGSVRKRFLKGNQKVKGATDRSFQKKNPRLLWLLTSRSSLFQN